MFKSGIRHLSKLSSLVISFELCFAPLALSQTNHHENAWKKTADTVGQMATMAMSMANGMQNQQQQGGSVDMFKAQLGPSMQMTPINPQEIPAVFQGCIVLPAAGVTLTGQYSCREADPGAVEAGYATAVKDLAEINYNELLAFTTQGHARYSTQGIGCYEKKLDDYKAMMAARQEELTAFSNTLQDRIENLTVALQNADGTGMKNVPIDEFLDLIKTDEALLTGKPDKFIKDVKFQNYLLGANDQVCKTFLSASNIQQEAAKGGLRAIQEDVFKKANNTQNGNMTADETLANAKEIKNEVRTYGRELSKIAKRKDGLEIDPNDVTYSSKLEGRISASLKRVAKQFNDSMKQELSAIEEESDVNQAVAGNQIAKQIFDSINSGNVNYEERVKSFERLSKSQCLRESITTSFGSIESFARSFRDPNVSRRLAKEADNSLANVILSQMNMQDNDLDSIVDNIIAHEKTGRNSRKVMRIDKTFEVEGKMYGGLPMRASQLLSVFKNNCIAKYERVRNADGFSTKQIVEKLNEYGAKYNQLKSEAPTKIANLLQDEIINCPEDTTTGSGALSCSDALNATSPNFCVRTAVSCASNMNGCLEKSRAAVKQVADKQKGKVNFLKQTTNELKNNIKRELASLTKFYETQARSLDAQLDIGTVFEMPEGMAFNLNADFKFEGEEAQGLNNEFNLEDPKAMLALAQEKVALLKDALEKHNQAIGDKLEDIKQTYIDNYNDQMDHWQDVIADCEERNFQHAEEKARAEEERLAQQEEIDRACAEIRAFNATGTCDDVGDLASTVQEVSMIASRQSGNASFSEDQQAYQTLGQIRSQCGGRRNSQTRSNRQPSSEDYVTFCQENPSDIGCTRLDDHNNDYPQCNDNFIEKAKEELDDKIVFDDRDRRFLCIKDDKIVDRVDASNCPGDAEREELERVATSRENDLREDIIEKVGCQDRESGVIHPEYEELLSDMRSRVRNNIADNPENYNSEMGENVQPISVAACNAQGDGFGASGKDYLDIMNQAMQQMNRGTASTQENSGTIPGN